MTYLIKIFTETLLQKITPSFDKPNFVVLEDGTKIQGIWATADQATIDFLLSEGYIKSTEIIYNEAFALLAYSNTMLYVSKTASTGTVLKNTELVTMYDAGHFKEYKTIEITHWEMKGSNMTKKCIDAKYLDGHFVEKGTDANINDYSVIEIIGVR